MRISICLAVSAFSVSAAFAADAAPSGVRFFGDAYLGGHVLFGNEAGEDFMVPMVDLGGRVAAQYGRFGGQIDAEYSGFDLAWVRPDIDLGDVSASVGALGLTGHASYNFNERFKAGAYFGYMRGSVSASDGFVSATVGIDSFVYGIEGLYQFDDNNWIEANAGFVDPRSIFVSLSAPIDLSGYDIDLPPTLEFSESINGLVDGLNLGAAFTHRFNPQWSATGKVNFTRLSAEGESVDFLSLKAIAAYQLQTMPLVLSTSLGYARISAAGQSADAFNIGTRLTFKFGDSGNDAGGKLFSSRRALDGVF